MTEQEAKRAEELRYWQDRAAWPDDKFLAEYAEQKRQEANASVEAIVRITAQEKADMDYLREHGSEEG